MKQIEVKGLLLDDYNKLKAAETDRIEDLKNQVEDLENHIDKKWGEQCCIKITTCIGFGHENRVEFVQPGKIKEVFEIRLKLREFEELEKEIIRLKDRTLVDYIRGKK